MGKPAPSRTATGRRKRKTLLAQYRALPLVDSSVSPEDVARLARSAQLELRSRASYQLSIREDRALDGPASSALVTGDAPAPALADAPALASALPAAAPSRAPFATPPRRPLAERFPEAHAARTESRAQSAVEIALIPHLLSVPALSAASPLRDPAAAVRLEEVLRARRAQLDSKDETIAGLRALLADSAAQASRALDLVAPADPDSAAFVAHLEQLLQQREQEIAELQFRIDSRAHELAASQRDRCAAFVASFSPSACDEVFTTKSWSPGPPGSDPPPASETFSPIPYIVDDVPAPAPPPFSPSPPRLVPRPAPVVASVDPGPSPAPACTSAPVAPTGVRRRFRWPTPPP